MTTIHRSENFVVTLIEPGSYSFNWDVGSGQTVFTIQDTVKTGCNKLMFIRTIDKRARIVKIELSIDKGSIETFSMMDHRGDVLKSTDKPDGRTLNYTGFFTKHLEDISFSQRFSFYGKLKCNNNNNPQTNIYQSKLIDDLVKLFKNKKYTDVTFKFIDGKEIQANKDVLAVRSDVFATMFKSDMKEANENCVNIDGDIDSDIFSEMLSFIYTAEVSNLDENAEKLLYVAEKYNLPNLKDMCENKLIFDLSLENVTNSLIQADKYRLINLKVKSMDLIISKSCDFIQTEDFKLLKKYPDLLSELFESAVMKWSEVKCNQKLFLLK